VLAPVVLRERIAATAAATVALYAAGASHPADVQEPGPGPWTHEPPRPMRARAPA
jgi:hypothetical protein